MQYIANDIINQTTNAILEYWNIAEIKRTMVKRMLTGGSDYSYEDKDIGFIEYSNVFKYVDGSDRFLLLLYCKPNNDNSENFQLLCDLVKKINKKLNNEYTNIDKEFTDRYRFLISVCKNGLSLKAIKKRGLDLYKGGE